MRTMAMAALAAAAIAAGTAPTASADQFCNHRFVNGDEITVKRFGSTSCSLARSGAAHVIDLGYAPPTVVAYSSVTHKHYKMYRVSHFEDATTFSCTYRGFGKGNTRIGFSLTIVHH